MELISSINVGKFMCHQHRIRLYVSYVTEYRRLAWPLQPHSCAMKRCNRLRCDIISMYSRPLRNPQTVAFDGLSCRKSRITRYHWCICYFILNYHGYFYLAYIIDWSHMGPFRFFDTNFRIAPCFVLFDAILLLLLCWVCEEMISYCTLLPIYNSRNNNR